MMSIKRITMIISTCLLVFFIALINHSFLAKAEAPLPEILNTSTIFSSNAAFVPMQTKQTKINAFAPEDGYWGKKGNTYIINEASIPQSWKGKIGLNFHNVGTYNGHTISIKEYITDWQKDKNKSNNTLLGLTSSLAITSDIRTHVTWKIYDEDTGKPLEVPMRLNFIDIDYNQGIYFNESTCANILKRYVTKYSSVEDIISNYGLMITGQPGTDKKPDLSGYKALQSGTWGSSTETFVMNRISTFNWSYVPDVRTSDAKNVIANGISAKCDKNAPEHTVTPISNNTWQRKFKNNSNARGYVSYSPISLAPITTPSPSLTISDSNERHTLHNILTNDNDTLTEETTQIIPYSLLPNYSEFQFKKYIIPGEKYTGIHITNENGKDVSSLFKTKLSTNSYPNSLKKFNVNDMPANNIITVTARPEALHSLLFYNHTYYFNIKLKLVPKYFYLHAMPHGRYSLTSNNQVRYGINHQSKQTMATNSITTDWYDSTVKNLPLHMITLPSITFDIHKSLNQDNRYFMNDNPNDSKIAIGSSIRYDSDWKILGRFNSMSSSKYTLKYAGLNLKFQPLKSELTGTSKAPSDSVLLQLNGDPQPLITMESGAGNWTTNIEDTQTYLSTGKSSLDNMKDYSGSVTYSLISAP